MFSRDFRPIMQLVDFYANAQLGELTSIEFEGMAIQFEERVIRISRDFLVKHGPEGQSELLYHFEEGSVKSSAKIIGALMAAYVAISQYPDFRKGVTQLYDDALSVSTVMLREFKNVTGARDKEIKYKRTISRDMSRLKRISHAVDLLSAPHLSDAEALSYRDMIASGIAELKRANPADPSIERLLDVLPRKRFPMLPGNMDEIMAIEEERRWVKPAPEETARWKVKGGPPRQRSPRRIYERIHKI